jgi:hypothetical protein
MPDPYPGSLYRSLRELTARDTRSVKVTSTEDSAMATKKKAARKTKRASKKNSLVANINRRKRAGKSRSKSKSTVSRKAYDDMQHGWPGKQSSKKKAKRAK